MRSTWFIAAALTLAIAPAVPAQPPAQDDALIGIWAFETTFGHALKGELTVAREGSNWYEASGNGGQLLIVVPDADLVVVFTGGDYRQGGIWGRWRHEIVGGELIPAIRR